MARFNERTILNQIHKPVAVPKAMYSEMIETPLSDGRNGID
jgi:hypothetical protein